MSGQIANNFKIMITKKTADIDNHKYLRVDGDRNTEDTEQISQPKWGQFGENVKIVKTLPVNKYKQSAHLLQRSRSDLSVTLRKPNNRVVPEF